MVTKSLLALSVTLAVLSVAYSLPLDSRLSQKLKALKSHRGEGHPHVKLRKHPAPQKPSASPYLSTTIQKLHKAGLLKNGDLLQSLKDLTNDELQKILS